MSEIWQSPQWPRFEYDVAATSDHLAQAMQSVGRVHGMVLGLGRSDQGAVNIRRMVQETLASFAIEGVNLSEDQIEASVIASLSHRAQSVGRGRHDALADLMVEARMGQGVMTPDTLFRWHRLLFHGVERDQIGQWRLDDIEIVRSAVAGQNDVLYRALPAEQVADAMNEFLAWLNDPPAWPIPCIAAIAHLWFESIHPFNDGNGRLGRALIDWVFARDQVLPFSLSRQIDRDKLGYYTALQAGRKISETSIDATPFVGWFLTTLDAAARWAQDDIGYILRRNQFWINHRAKLNSRQIRLFETLFAQGADRIDQGIAAKAYVKITKTSPATATRDLSKLEDLGIISRSAQGGRSTRYLILW